MKLRQVSTCESCHLHHSKAWWDPNKPTTRYGVPLLSPSLAFVFEHSLNLLEENWGTQEWNIFLSDKPSMSSDSFEFVSCCCFYYMSHWLSSKWFQIPTPGCPLSLLLGCVSAWSTRTLAACLGVVVPCLPVVSRLCARACKVTTQVQVWARACPRKAWRAPEISSS